MSRFSWRKWSAFETKVNRRKAKCPVVHRLPLHLERLEDRTVPANVAILGAEQNASFLQDVKNTIVATGKYNSGQVDIFNVASSTPTLATLNNYSSVLVFSDNFFQDPNTLGNNLASYVNEGHGVVDAMFDNLNGFALGGIWASGEYSPLVAGGSTGGSAGLGAVAQPGHAVMAGVTSFFGGGASYRGTSGVTGPLIASWSDGQPLVAEKLGRFGKIIGLNFWPVSNNVFGAGWIASTQGGLLMANALQYTAPAPPTAASFSFSTDSNLPQPVTLSGVTHTGTLSYTVLSGPSHGSLTGTAPNLTYTPGTNYLGSDSFTYNVNDGISDSEVATVSITVVAAPSVVSVAPSLSPGALTAGATTLQINFSQAVVGADQAGNYQMQSVGADGLLGTADDVIVPLSVTYSGTTATLSFAALPDSVYRLTVKDAITDAAGNNLDGDGDGNPGGNYVRDFVDGALTTTLTSPNSFTFDPTFGGFGAGQLVQGTSNAFDGLNRLQVGGSDYVPALPTIPGADAVAQQTLTPNAFGGNANYSLPNSPAALGLSTTVTVADAAERYRVDAALSLYAGNPSPVYAFVYVDNAPTAVYRYARPASAGYGTLDVGGYLSLAPGVHTIDVRLSSPAGGVAVVSDYYDTDSLTVLRLKPAPSPTLSNGGITVATPTQTLAGLTVHREISVPNTGSQDFARAVDYFQNPTGSPITTTVHIIGNLGSDAATRVFATSSGDSTPSPSDEWFGTDSGPGTTAVLTFVHGPSGLMPTTEDIVGDNIEWTYTITVQPGQTLELATLTILANTQAAAIDAANALVTPSGFGGHAADFLSAADLAALANFQFNQPPVAVDDTASAATDTPVTIAVLANDSDPDGDPLTVQSVTSPAHGAAVINGDGTVTYTPALHYHGADNFTYTISDGRGGTATATVHVSVAGPNLFVVTATADSGPGSLRQAILDANATPDDPSGPNIIEFHIGSGGVQTIAPLSALPAITDAVTIDGSSQPGFVGTALIELNGENLGSVDGLDVNAAGSTIRGLVLDHWGNSAVGVFADATRIIGNVISANAGYGIYLASTSNSVIQGNRIGTNPAGTAAAPNGYGILLNGAVHHLQIGGANSGEGNLVSGNTNRGLWINDGDTTTIQGNFIGTDVTGSYAIANGSSGISVWHATSTDILIGGTTPGAGNLISGNGDGIDVAETVGPVTIQGNLIGTDVTGTNPIPNANGVRLRSASGTNVGGVDPTARNLISGNSGSGVLMQFSTATVSGNFIGTNVAGTVAVPNGSGIVVDTSEANDHILNNLVSGNNGPGISVGGTGSVVQGNKVGTDETGTVALPNHGPGVTLYSSHGGLIGGPGAGQGNLISGNTGAGVDISYPNDSSGNRVQGNLIGTNAAGTAALGNGGDGIFVYYLLANDNVIGGTNPGEGNIISGNLGNGIAIRNSSITIQRNAIGTDAGGTLQLGNAGDGVLATNSAHQVLVGGFGVGNVIAYNGQSGVEANLGAVSIAIRANSIHDNAGPGINLNYGGNAGNNNQSYPTLDAASVGGTLHLAGSLVSTPNSTFTLDFYASAHPGAGGFGDGQRFLGAFSISTDGQGTAHFNAHMGWPVAPGEYLTATATDSASNTSAFSRAVAVNATSFVNAFIVTNTADAGPGSLRQALNDSNATPDDPAGPNVIQFAIPGSGVQTIVPSSIGGGVSLPVITNTVIVDGWSQGGSGYTGSPLIELDGENAPSTFGLNIQASNCVVRGLDINRYAAPSGNGFAIGLFGASATHNWIYGNYLGTDPTGLVNRGNGQGGIWLASGANSNRIGTNDDGTNDAAERNVISGNFFGDGILVQSVANTIAGNYIGLGADGRTPMGNANNGIRIDSIVNQIGGTDATSRNVISGNHGAGILLNGTGASGNQIQGNFIGTDVTGTVAVGNGLANGSFNAGIQINNASSNFIAGNLISGNVNAGVFVTGDSATLNVLSGNLIGTDITGTHALGNGLGTNFAGVRIASPGNTVGGTDPASRNVISANGGSGVATSATNTIIRGNLIGTDVTGTVALGNHSAGISVNHNNVPVGFPEANTIGGPTAACRNVIAGNGGDGINISGGPAQNFVQGNFIGTNAAGTSALPNAGNGVQVTLGATTNLIGGTTSGSGNVISGNRQNGILINGSSASGNQVVGNFIGTDATGTRALGNVSNGVWINQAPGNTIGGTSPGYRNVISGNDVTPDDWGLLIQGNTATNNFVQGNYIGTDVTGSLPLANGVGVVILAAGSNTIGGTASGAGNVISGNNGYFTPGILGNGVVLTGAGTTGNVVAGNRIGTKADAMTALPNTTGGVLLSNGPTGNTIGSGNVISGNLGTGIALISASGNFVQGNAIGIAVDGTTPLGNSGVGVSVTGGANNDILGGVTPGQGNTIAFSGSDGVQLGQASGIAVRGNSIHDNAGLGINLGSAGGNNGQTAPLLVGAIAGTTTSVSGTFASALSSPLTLDFYASPLADPSGFGEGQRYLGSLTVASGSAAFVADGLGATTVGEVISATATDGAGNTSAFSADVIASTVSVTAGGPYSIHEGDSLALGSAANNPLGVPLTYSWTVNGHAGAASGPNPTLTWAQLQALGIDDGPATFSLSVAVDDGHGHTPVSPAATLSLSNSPPTAALSTAPATNPEGTAIHLTGSATDPSAADTAAGFTFAWSVTKNGSPFALGTGAAVAFTPDDDGTYVVTLSATNEDGDTGTTTQTIAVTNVPPTAGLSGPAGSVVFQPLIFTLSATDPSPVDQAAGFTFTVNWGDGTSETLSGPSGMQHLHAYSSAGTYQVSMAATDGDGGVSTAVSQSVVVVATAQLQNGVLAVPGTSGNDTFTLTPVLPNGASAYSMRITRSTGGVTTNLGTFAIPTGTIQLFGGPGPDSVILNGTANNDTFTVGGGVLGEIAAAGTAQATSFTVALNGSAATINGAGGNNTLVGTDPINSWSITAANAGRLNGTSFSAMQNLTGGNGDSSFYLANNGSITGVIDGGAGTNTLDFSGRTSPVTVTLQTSGLNRATGIGGWRNIARLIGSSASTLVGPDQSNIWTIDSLNRGTVGAYSFFNFPNLTGGSLDDTFEMSLSGMLSGTLSGGAGSNTLWAPVVYADTFNITATNAGNLATLAGAFTFTAIQNLHGGSIANTFVFSNGKGITGNLDGGVLGGTLNYASYTTSVSVNLGANKATGVGGLATNLVGAIGGSALNTLTGANIADTWHITDTNAGDISGRFHFSAFGNLTGGSSTDFFAFADQKGVTGTIDGGADGRLDYSAYSTGIYVNLRTLAATGTGRVRNIRGVYGAGHNDILVGNGSGILLQETAGNNLLIGGSGLAALSGGSGFDLVICGSTSYDTNAAALQAIEAFWAATNAANFLTQVATLSGPGISGGSIRLNNSTVTHANAADTVFLGSVNDWLFLRGVPPLMDVVTGTPRFKTFV
jgi:parallel beta-helix repeat protein